MDEFSLLFSNPEDKPYNNSGRKIGNDLYESSILLSVEKVQTNDSIKDISSFVDQKKLYLSIDKNVWIISDFDVGVIDYHHRFTFPVDIFLLIDNLLMIGLSNGEIHLVDTIQKKILTNCVLYENISFGTKYFVGIYQEVATLPIFLILTKKGLFFRVEFDITNAELKTELIVDLAHNITTACYMNNKLMAIGSQLIVYDMNDAIIEELMLESNLPFKNIWPCHMFSCLAQRTDGSLWWISPHVPCMKQLKMTDQIDDFLFYYYKKKSYMYYVGQESNLIKLVEFNEDKSEVFSLNVEYFEQLVYTNDEDGSQMYLTKQTNCVRIYLIQESKPEDRLKRLVFEKLYDEAEVFAQQYKLNRTEIDKAKVKNIAEKISCSDEDVDELLALMVNIPNEPFKVVACQDVVSLCETVAGVEKIIDFWMSLSCQDMRERRTAELVRNTTVASLDTVKSLARCAGEEVTVASWQRLLKRDLFEYLITCLQNGELEAAIIVFSRLSHAHFTLENIARILGYLGEYEHNQFTSLLFTMIPSTLLNLPAALEVFVETIIDKVHNMEQQRREIEFPEKAIAFVDKVVQIIFDDTLQGDKTPMSDKIDAMKPLINISECLNTILKLKNNFSVYLPLQDCLAGPGAMLRALLRFHVESLDTFLRSFLIKFMLQNNFDTDEVLAGEINLMQGSKHDYWTTEIPQIWSCISSTSRRIELLLEFLRVSPKPWCTGVQHMLAEALKFNHPRVEVVQTELQNEAKYIVMYRTEYLLRNETINSAEDDFVLQRVIYCNLPTLIEDVYTLCTSPEAKCIADFYLLLHFIELNDLSKVYTLVKRFSSDEASDYIFKLCQTFEINLLMVDGNLRSTLIKSLNFLQEKATPNKTHAQFINVFNIIDALPTHMLCFELYEKLLTKSGRKEIRDAVVREMSLETEDFDELLKLSKKYGRVFCKSYESILFQVCQLSRNPVLLHRIAVEMYENSADVKVLSLFTVFMLANMGTDQDDMYGTFFNNTISKEDSDNPVDETLLRKCLVLSRRIITKAFSLSDSDPKVGNVAKWVYIQNQMCSEATLNKGTISSTTTTDAGVSNICTLSAVRQVFIMNCDYYRISLKCPAMEYLTYKFMDKLDGTTSEDEDLPISLESHCHQVTRHLQNALLSILRENQHWTLQQLLVTLQGTMLLVNDGAAFEPVQKMILEVKAKLITHVFAAPVINDDIAFYLLMSFPRKKALKVINKAVGVYHENFIKFEAIVRLGLRITTVYNSTDHYGLFMLGVKWRKALTECTIPLTDFFVKVTSKDLLGTLITQHEITLEQITEFCADFSLDAQMYYLQYLNDLISTWKPSYKVHMDTLGARSAVVDDDGELDAKCLKVVELMKNRDEVKQCIDALWSTLNFYHYEAYLAILSVAAALNDSSYINYRAVLHFLKTYQRFSKPSDLESEEWYAIMAQTHQQLDAISEWRFPFLQQVLFTPDLWKILRSEIKLSNYVKWFDLVDMLKYLNRDGICSYVIKDFNFVYEGGAGDANTYILQPMYEDTFASIDTCLAYITDPLLAASMAFHLVPKPADGADRVIAAKLAYKYAKKCKKSGVEDATYKQIEKIYFTYTSKHILHVHNLATEEYLSLLNNPNDLINALYRDDRILKGANASLAQCPDINKATDELAVLFNIDISAKRIELLYTLINENSSLCGDSDASIYLSPEMNYTGDQNTECVLRAAYVCASGEAEVWRSHLYQMFDQSEQSLLQGRLLKTLCMITSPEELSEKYGCSWTEIRDSIDSFFVVHDLNSLGIMLDMEKYSAMDKNRLLYKLGKQLSDPLNVKVMIAICNQFHIYDLEIWEKITIGMIELNMISDLKKCLLMFIKFNIMIRRDIYCKAWQAVVDSSIKSLSTTSQDIDAVLSSLLYFVQASPVLNQLNLRDGYLVCIKLRKFSYALLFLQYEPKIRRDECLAELLRICDKQKLLAELEKLQNMGFTGLKCVKKILGAA